MKKIFIYSALSILLFSVLSYPYVVSAHTLIPKALTEYIKSHPGATPEEIQAFANSSSPAFASKYKNGEEIVAVVRNTDSSFFDNCIDFFKIGMEHILSGADHILFVLSIILVYVSIRRVLHLTLTFTIAHSITLLLAGSGLLVLSSRIVEPFIAFSIAYMAIVSVFFEKVRYIGGENGKVGSIFFFGLFHGLGFAGLLKEIQIPNDKFISSLFSFNVGIEIGQLIIIMCTLPFIYALRHKHWYPRLIQIIAVIIAVLGIFWGISRILGFE